MKRFIILALCLTLALTAVSAQAVSLAKVVGRWYFTSVEGTGLPGDSYIEFNRDKTVTLVLSGTAKDMSGFEWTVDGDRVMVTEKGGFMPEFDMYYADDVLTMQTTNLGELAGNRFFPTFTLARTAATYDTPALADAASEEEFFGEYYVYLLAQNGQYTQMSGEGNGFDISEFVAVVNTEGQEPQECLTNFKDGKLIVYGPSEIIISKTADPDVIAFYEPASPASIGYLRRKGTQPSAAPTQAPVVPVPAPAVTEAPAAQPTEKPSTPTFPGMATLPVAPAKAAGDAAAFYGSYTVYQDKLANGTVLDMTPRGIRAVIDENGMHVTAYGQKLTAPYEYKDGRLSADISAIYPSFGFAVASLADNGELVVTLADSAGTVGETLYLRK